MATNRKQISKLFSSVKIGNMSDITPEALSENLKTPKIVSIKNRGQTEDKVETNRGQKNHKTKFSTLSKLQKSIVLAIYQLSHHDKEKTTKEISVSELSALIESSVYSVKKTIGRLVLNTDILSRVDYKNGRGGWTKYKLSQSMFSEIKLLRAHSEFVGR